MPGKPLSVWGNGFFLIRQLRTIKGFTDGYQFFKQSFEVALLSKSAVMNKSLEPEIQEVMGAVHYRPAVSIIMPFEVKLNLQKEVSHSLKVAADNAERQLLDNYPRDISMAVMQKLHRILDNLSLPTDKESIAIYVSPIFEKVVYLDVAVEERVIVDESFEIRDLLYSKSKLHKYLLLLLTGRESRMFLADTQTFTRIVPDISESVFAYVNDAPEKVENFSDTSARKEMITDKFLMHVNKALHKVLDRYQLPLFVLGTERILSRFKEMSKISEANTEFIQGNYEEASPGELWELVQEHIKEHESKKNTALLKQLEEAINQQKLAIGITDVWRETMNHKGRLLVVEKDYVYPAQRGSDAGEIYETKEPYNHFSYIKDAVDDVIEQVLKDGGDVEFVDKDVLNTYRQIALVEYY